MCVYVFVCIFGYLLWFFGLAFWILLFALVICKRKGFDRWMEVENWGWIFNGERLVLGNMRKSEGFVILTKNIKMFSFMVLYLLV